MSNRVNVNINVNDNSRRGLASLRQSMNRMQRDARRAGGNIRFNVRIDEGTTRREFRRIQRSMRGQPVTITTQLDPPTPSPRTLRQRIQRGLGRSVALPVRLTTRGLVGGVRGPLRALGGLASGIMQDGIGQGLVNGFKAGGPIGVAFLGTLLLGLASIVGAALSGLLITAFGLAFVGLAGASAATSKEVKAQWGETLESLKENFRTIGEPMIPVLTRALGIVEDLADRAAPKFAEAIERTVPATNKFIDGLIGGIEDFGKASFDKIMDAWNVFAPVFGEQFKEFMRELGEAFGEMADFVKEHPTEIAMALEIVFETIELLIRTVTFLGEVWVGQMRVMLGAIGYLAAGMASFVDGFFGMIDGLLGALQSVAEPLGLAGPIKRARENVAGFKAQAVEQLNAIGQAGINFGINLDRANKKRRLEADIASWQHKLSTARADLRKTTSQKARAKVQANIDDLTAKLRRARNELAALNGRTATTYVRTVQYGIGAEAANAARRAHGGVIGTAATGGVRGNLTMVGEQGPELVQLPTGSHVRSNPDTRRILGGSGRTGPPARLIIDAAGDDVSQLLLKLLRNAIRNEGGDVQVVLGGRTI